METKRPKFPLMSWKDFKINSMENMLLLLGELSCLTCELFLISKTLKGHEVLLLARENLQVEF